VSEPGMSVFDEWYPYAAYARVRERVSGRVAALREDEDRDARPSRNQRWLATIAIGEALKSLSYCDEVTVDAMTAYAAVMLRSGRYRHMRPVLGLALRLAHKSLGTDSEPYRRLRAATERAAEAVASRHHRAITRARRRLERARHHTGPASEQTLTAARRLADRYRKAFRLRDMAELYERTVAEARTYLGDRHPRASAFAEAGAFECLDAGETVAALRLFEYHLETKDSQLTDVLTLAPVQVTDHLQAEINIYRVSAWSVLVEFLVSGGAADRAERLAQQALRLLQDLIAQERRTSTKWPGRLEHSAVAESTAGRASQQEPALLSTNWSVLLPRIRSTERMKHLHRLEHATYFALGNCLAAQGKWPEAHENYRTAYQRLNLTDADYPTAAQYYTAVVFSSRRWTEY
jgi:tetratricopeptide (TPR) repeat protein